MLNDSPLKLSPILGESFKLSPKIGQSLRLSPNPWLSPNLGDPLLNVVLLKWPTLQGEPSRQHRLLKSNCSCAQSFEN